MDQINSDKDTIYYIETEQKMALEKEISKSLVTLQNLFQKEEILKFLFKCIDEGKYDFNEESQDKENPLTEDEISKKKDEFCRELKEMFDQIDPQIFQKYNNRIGKATIRIMMEINKKKKIIDNPKRKVKIKRINPDSNDNVLKYQKLDQLKSLIKETIYISSFYNNELVNVNNPFIQKLEEFYNGKSNIELINNINGEEKKCKDDDLIKRIVNTKENLGKQFIIDTKNYITETTKEQIDLNNKITKEMNEINNIKEQQLTFDEYRNSKNNYFKEINQVDFY
jgi:hypothetical protein